MTDKVNYYLGTNVEVPLHLQETVRFPELSDNSFLGIEGWFGAQQAYFISKIIDSLPDGASIVEIGAWMGKSTRFTAQYLKDKNRKIKYTVIDTFKGSQNEQLHLNIVASNGGTVRNKFYQNIEPVKDFVSVIEEDSNVAHKSFEDNSLDLVFIDGDHSFEQVCKDIFNFYPKVKNNGIISGDDYRPVWGVFNAVPLMLGTINTNIFGQIWWSLKKDNAIMENKIGYTD